MLYLVLYNTVHEVSFTLQKPMQYLKMMTSSASRYIIGSVWVLSFLICLPAFLADAEHAVVAAALLESSNAGSRGTDPVLGTQSSQHTEQTAINGLQRTHTSSWNDTHETRGAQIYCTVVQIWMPFSCIRSICFEEES